MTDVNQNPQPPRPARVGLDTWAVLLALVLVGLVRLGWLPTISW